MGRSRRHSPPTLQSWDELLSDVEAEMTAEQERKPRLSAAFRPAYSRPLLIGAICLVLVSWLGSKDVQVVSTRKGTEMSFQRSSGTSQQGRMPEGSSSTGKPHQISVPPPSESGSSGVHTFTQNQALPAPLPESQTASSNTSPLSPESLSKTHRILSLGGSTTWGAKIESRADAYPLVLAERLGQNWTAVNLAVRATGASYASQCIETMIREGAPQSDDNVEFDVILLEYSLNGLEGMELLLERLQRRYPKAIFIYVHLYSLRMSVHNTITNEQPRQILNEGLKFTEADEKITSMLANPAAAWSWSDSMVEESRQVSIDATQTMSKLNGHVYEFPRPDTPQQAMDEHWFGQDYHHLSAKGHDMVASGILDLLHRPGTSAQPQTELRFQDHTWGKGDQCYSWYETGESPSVKIRGGTMKMFVKPDKWALHVGQRFGAEASMEFPNTSQDAQPVELFLMTWGDPSIYPHSTVTLKASGDDATDSSMILDPLHPVLSQRIYHITHTIHIGWAKPGTNSLRILPNETTERPLRVTGLVMCGACVEMDGSYLNVAVPDDAS